MELDQSVEGGLESWDSEGSCPDTADVEARWTTPAICRLRDFGQSTDEEVEHKEPHTADASVCWSTRTTDRIEDSDQSTDEVVGH